MKIGTVYKGESEDKNILFSRVWAMPSPWTFQIGPIQKLLERYVGNGERWLDPYAGKYSPAQITNDFDPKHNTLYHLDSLEFSKIIKERFKGILWKGILYDPPYSFRQISEHYKAVGEKATQLDTSSNFYERTKSAFCEMIEVGGIAISFGWNSNGFGKKRGFEIIEIMLVSHGGSKHDTIIVVEKKIKSSKSP